MTKINIENLAPGETFTVGGKLLRVKEVSEDTCCEGCFFSKKENIYTLCEELDITEPIPNCEGTFREDKKFVIFEEVEK